jgi:hypothetical protein
VTNAQQTTAGRLKSGAAFEAEAEEFTAATGLCFFELVSGSHGPSEGFPQWIVDWATRLSSWDTWLMVGGDHCDD